MARTAASKAIPIEALSRKRTCTSDIIARLKAAYPNARCTLDFTNPLELLVATVLSAQCTDQRVNMVTKSLFKKYRTARAYALAPPGELEMAATCARLGRPSALRAL